ncbi:MAG: hypothetical protein NTY64_05085, partial [Deltaproteobacteria bacterium]|nr:hypothetical protein [Deltaproteobacteria bacterium]
HHHRWCQEGQFGDISAPSVDSICGFWFSVFSVHLEYLDLNYARKVVVKMKENEKEKSRKS